LAKYDRKEDFVVGKPYQTPELTVYGNILELTRSGTVGAKNDKASGPNKTT
jgi:hypothetical protein